MFWLSCFYFENRVLENWQIHKLKNINPQINGLINLTVITSLSSPLFLFIQAQVSAIPLIRAKRRNTAAALVRTLKMYRAFLVRPNAPRIPNLLFLMATGPSSDTRKFIAVRNLYRKAGIWELMIDSGGNEFDMSIS